LDDYELIAQELSSLREAVKALDVKVSGFEQRMTEAESMNGRLEDAALTTARALADISRHWDAVYEAMRREESRNPNESSG
jgi:predicted phage tail protein